MKFSNSVIIPWSILTMLTTATTAAPIDNSTSSIQIYQTSWVAEPKGRGTLSILRICVSTLFLCVWNAMHLNIRINISGVRRGFYKIKLVLLAMFFPEVMLLAALIDHREARRFLAEWRKRNHISPVSSEYLLDMEGSFFVFMGGFSVGKVEDYSQFSNILTPNGLLFLFENGLISPEVFRKRSIADKNKADVFVKLLVFLQITWMGIQCLMRAIGHVSVTTLESHVVLHGIYTIFTYAIWWYKPLDITDPIPVINDPELASLVVVLLAPHSRGQLSGLSTEISSCAYSGISRDEIRDESETESETEKLGTKGEFLYTFRKGDTSRCRRKRGAVDKISFHVRKGSTPKKAIRSPTPTGQSPRNTSAGERSSVISGENKVASLFIKRWLMRMQIVKKLYKHSEISPQPVSRKVLPTEYIVLGGRLKISLNTSTEEKKKRDDIVLKRTDIINLHSAARAVNVGKHLKIAAAVSKYNKDAYDEKMPLLIYKPRMHNIYNKRPSNDTSAGRRQNYYIRGLTTIVFVIFPVSYSGWHAMYWNRHFPTPAECYLWKLSSILVGVIPLIYELVCIIDGDVSRMKVFLKLVEVKINRVFSFLFTLDGDNVSIGRKVANILKYVGNSLLIALLILFLFGRSFLVIEAFISLRSLPQDSFETPY